jgi:hypothetical protein
MGKYLKRHFTKETGRQMAGKGRRISLTSLFIKIMPIKSTMRYNYIPKITKT